MMALSRLLAIVIVAAKRLLAQRGLTLGMLLGLTVSVALTMSIPLYADAAYNHILSDRILTARNESYRPPFAFLFRYLGSNYGALQWADIQAVDQYLASASITAFGVPRQTFSRYVETTPFLLSAPDGSPYGEGERALLQTRLATLTDFDKHVTIVEGRWPDPAPDAVHAPVDILIGEPIAEKLGVQIGEIYKAEHIQSPGTTPPPALNVRIAGIWRANNPDEEYWIYKIPFLEELSFVPEATFSGRIASMLNDEVGEAAWHFVMDGSRLHASDVDGLVSQIATVEKQANSLLPNLELDISPADNLRKYQTASNLLTILLYTFSIPIIGLILVFVGLVVNLVVGNQHNEIAVLRSRGATVMQVVGIATLEALILGIIGLAVGSLGGNLIAQVMGRARSFLDFTAPSLSGVNLNADMYKYGLAAIALTLVAQVLPTVTAAKHTVVTYKQERARSIKPWWQRAWIDVLVLIPAIYGLYLLQEQGSLTFPIVGRLSTDPFKNPLLFLLPVLLSFGVTLLILRLIPYAMAGLAWVAARTDSVGLLLAARYLARTPGSYSAPLLLLILTLSLSTFTASLAETFNRNLIDQQAYAVGADLRLVEMGEQVPTGSGEIDYSGMTGPGSPAGQQEMHWVFMPVSEHLRIPGVEAAARVGEFEGRIQTRTARAEIKYLAVDRVDFGKVAFWRQDFAGASLGALLNQLAQAPDAVLVPNSFMAQQGLSIGDSIHVTVDTYGQSNGLDLRVAGGFDLFPTYYPDSKPLLVGNLDYLFDQVGGEVPYSVWLSEARNTDPQQIVDQVKSLGLRVFDWSAPQLQVYQEQQRPERQGLFGLLSVGFGAAAILTVIGFFLYALFSFRRRFIELGILRAVGLSSLQMTAFLAGELAFLLLVGLIAGTALGIGVSRLFMPYLQLGAEASARIPPFISYIAWDSILHIYALFGLLFISALLVLVRLLLNMRIFEAIKLGETT